MPTTGKTQLALSRIHNLDITSVYDRWLNACSAFPMWRGETGFRYNDYYGSLAVERGCLSNFKRAVALMAPAEQTCPAYSHAIVYCDAVSR